MLFKIKELRKGKGLTQSELAGKIDVSVRTFSEYENETSDIPFKKLQNIAEILEVSIFELIIDDKKGKEELKEKTKLSQADFREKLIEVLEIQNSDLKNDKIEILKDKSKIIEMLEEKLRNCEDEKKRNKIIG